MQCQASTPLQSSFDTHTEEEISLDKGDSCVLRSRHMHKLDVHVAMSFRMGSVRSRHEMLRYCTGQKELVSESKDLIKSGSKKS